jgi:hypothetical protein
MLRAIRVLAVAALVALALAAGMVFTRILVDESSPSASAFYVPRFAFDTGTLLSFSAGLLTLALTVPRRHRPWSAALVASLILNAYWLLALDAVLETGIMISSTADLAINVISYGLAPAAPALLAFVYTLRAARSAPQAAPAVEEPGSLDLTIEPLGSKTR